MSDDELEIEGLKMPTKWAVGVIGAIVTALGSAGAGMYQYGQLAGELAELKINCAKVTLMARAQNEASTEQSTPEAPCQQQLCPLYSSQK